MIPGSHRGFRAAAALLQPERLGGQAAGGSASSRTDSDGPPPPPPRVPPAGPPRLPLSEWHWRPRRARRILGRSRWPLAHSQPEVPRRCQCLLAQKEADKRGWRPSQPSSRTTTLISSREPRLYAVVTRLLAAFLNRRAARRGRTERIREQFGSRGDSDGRGRCRGKAGRAGGEGGPGLPPVRQSVPLLQSP